MSKRKVIIYFFLVVFFIQCRLSEITEMTKSLEENSALLQLLDSAFFDSDKTISRSTGFSSDEENLLSSFKVEDIKKRDNVSVSSDVVPSSISLKLDRAYFRSKNIEVSIIKDSIIQDDLSGTFSYKIRLEKNKLYKILTISYTGFKKKYYNYIYAGSNISLVLDSLGIFYASGGRVIESSLNEKPKFPNSFNIIDYRKKGINKKVQKAFYCKNTFFLLDVELNSYMYKKRDDGDPTYVPGFKSLDSKIKKLACSSNSTLFITEDNFLMGTGSNQKGQLGLGDRNDRDDFEQIMTGIKVKQISADSNHSSNHSLVVTMNNNLYVFGDNKSYGVLGLGNATVTVNPTEILALRGIAEQVSTHMYHTSVVTTDNRIFMTGSCLNIGNTDCANQKVFRERGGPEVRGKVKKVINAQFGVFITTTDGILMAIGDNTSGDLFLAERKIYNDFQPVILPKGVQVKDISVGLDHVLILTTDSRIMSVGSNIDGELGLGDNNRREKFTEVSMPK